MYSGCSNLWVVSNMLVTHYTKETHTFFGTLIPEQLDQCIDRPGSLPLFAFAANCGCLWALDCHSQAMVRHMASKTGTGSRSSFRQLVGER